MLFKNVTGTIENSNNQVIKLTKTISGRQSFYLKKVTRKNFNLKKRLQKIGINLKNSDKI